MSLERLILRAQGQAHDCFERQTDFANHVASRDPRLPGCWRDELFLAPRVGF